MPTDFISTIDEYKDKVILYSDYTKGMNPEDKKKAIMIAHPEWFDIK